MLDVAVKAVIFLSHLGFRLEYLLFTEYQRTRHDHLVDDFVCETIDVYVFI